MDKDERGPGILHSKVGKAIKKLRDKMATGDDDIPRDVLKTVGRRWSQNKETTDQHA